MAITLAQGLSPEAHGSLCKSVNERQQQLDILAAQEREKPVVTLRRVV
ncbi:hypothetical protein C3B79_1394 [Aeromonas hydrophila]|nr:hypothetical protein C3B79_1394 [Aeromonas hydrophila]